MDKLWAMTTVVQIAERGSLTAAANALGTSLSSVVRTLAALESDLGVRLLNRTTRRVHLTDEGAKYVERCRLVLSELRDIEAALTSDQASPQGRLKVTTGIFLGTRYISTIANSFIQRYPDVRVDLLLAPREVNLVEEGFDVAIRIGHLKDSSLIAIPVGQVRRVICASPQYLRRYGTPRVPDDLRAHRCVRHTALAPRDAWEFRIGRRVVTIPITSVLSCNEATCALQACAHGLGVGAFLSYQVAEERKSGRLKYLLEEFETKPLPMHVIYPQSRLLPTRTRLFIDECTKELRRIPFQ